MQLEAIFIQKSQNHVILHFEILNRAEILKTCVQFHNFDYNRLWILIINYQYLKNNRSIIYYID